jgi:hypothetical protein
MCDTGHIAAEHFSSMLMLLPEVSTACCSPKGAGRAIRFAKGDISMACHTVISPVREPKPESRPVLASYDDGHEHSVEHLIELRRMVEEAAKERPIGKKRSLMAKA